MTPLLGEAEAPDPELVALYDRLFPIYRDSYAQALRPIWHALADAAGAEA